MPGSHAAAIRTRTAGPHEGRPSQSTAAPQAGNPGVGSDAAPASSAATTRPSEEALAEGSDAKLRHHDINIEVTMQNAGDDKILAAMAAGCTLHDGYEAGYKHHSPSYWRYVQHPTDENKFKSVSYSAIRRLEDARLIVANGSRGAGGQDHEITLSLTDAGRERAATVAKFDLEKYMAAPRVYLKPTERALLAKIEAGTDAEGKLDCVADGTREIEIATPLDRMKRYGFIVRYADRKYMGEPMWCSITDAGRTYLAGFATRGRFRN
jgi:DNA-binding PadR family transcriptional regulator